MRKSLAASIAFLLCLLAWRAWAGAPTLDTNHGGGNQSGGTTITVSATTASTNNVVMVAVVGGTSVAGGTPITFTVTGCSLTWHNRTRQAAVTAQNRPLDVETWWASAATTLSGCTITATADRTIDDASIGYWSVNNLFSQSSPFDSNVGLPYVLDCHSCSTSTDATVSITTTQADDLIFAVIGTNTGNFTGLNFSPGYLILITENNSGGSYFSSLNVWYKIVSSKQTGATVDTTDSLGDFYYWVDALTGDVNSASSPVFFRSFP